MTFEWDDIKEAENIEKHGVDFWLASEVFADPLKRTYYDEENSDEEVRWLTFGKSSSGQFLVASWTDREPETIRIISARLMEPQKEGTMKAQYDLKKLKKRKPEPAPVDLAQAKVQLSIRIDYPVLAKIRQEAQAKGIGYQTLINSLLTEAMNGRSAGSIIDQVRQAVREELQAVIK